jgi:CO/xanthine dehydrogenase Mo-binding subunit/CO/xanthine dehydrogenase FAD-binding subunit
MPRDARPRRRVIGRPVKPVDSEAVTTGAAAYAADIRLPDELAGGVLRSPHPHARIMSIDVARASRVPGVHAVLTAADLPDRKYIDYRPQDADRYPLARDVVRHIGDPVAIVAAESTEAMRQALEAIRVRYRRLPAAPDVAAALSPSARPIHAQQPDNVAKRVHRQFGDPAEGTVQSTHRIRAHYQSGRQAHATMEPHTVLAHWDGSAQRLDMWAPSQAPRVLQRDLAQLFGLELGQVRMHELTVGGDFGGRTQISSTEALAAALTLATGRPVRLAQTRAEEFAFTKSRLSWDLDLELGCDGDGRLTHLEADFDVDNGAYNQAGPGEMEYGSIALGSSYRWRSYRARGRCVYTNKQPPSSFRGAGGYAVTWALECAVDELAEQLGIDPIDFRLMNALCETGERSITGWQVKSSGLEACLNEVRERIGWDAKRLEGGNGRGVGVACSVHVTALKRDYMVRSQAAIDIHPDGTVTLRSGVGDAGTGQKTLLCQTVAEVLGVDLADVRIISTDTSRTPHDAGAGASRGTFTSVSTVKQLSDKARSALVATAADKLHVDPSSVRWEDGAALHGEDVLTLGDLAALAAESGGPLTIEDEFVGESAEPNPDGLEDISPTYSFAAHGVEVAVDEATGAVQVLRVVAAHDSGTILNPLTARGQVEGGVVMGIGAVLSEELIFDAGRVVNTSYVDYAIPRSPDAPNIETVFIPSDDGVGPFGAKGLGEITLLTVGPALTNAIAHAIGTRIRHAPLTPDKVLTAIRKRDESPHRAGSVGWNPKRWWIAGMRALYPRGLHRVLHRYGRLRRPAPTDDGIRAVHAPSTVPEALATLARERPAAPLGGGTDLLVRERQGLPIAPVLVSTAACHDLAAIRRTPDGGLQLGGAATLTALLDHRDVDEVLRSTIAEIAAPGIRNAATLAGNLCQEKRCWFFRNGFDCYKRSGVLRPCYAVMGDHRFYHAVEGAHRCQAVTPSDLATTLLALDASVHVQSSSRGSQVRDIDKLYTGPGEVALREDELITRVTISPAARSRRSLYRKLALWHGGFAVAALCVSAADPTAGQARDVRISLGGVSPRPQRVTRLEKMLEGHRITAELLDRCSADWLARTYPLPGNHWKAFATSNLLHRALRDLFGADPG